MCRFTAHGSNMFFGFAIVAALSQPGGGTHESRPVLGGN